MLLGLVGSIYAGGTKVSKKKRSEKEQKEQVVPQPQGVLSSLGLSQLEGRESVMQHLAIIPDGNRRYAKAHKMETFLGHRKGLDVVKIAMQVCKRNGIKHLSFYTFSLENFKRGETEKNYLFNMLATEFHAAIPELKKERVRVRFVGDSSYYPAALQATIAEVEAATAGGDALNLNLLFCYGGRQELVHAAQVIAQKVKDGTLDPSKITEETINSALWTAGTPDPELIIRTGMEKSPRTSNFLPFQSVYSEWMYVEDFWPAMTDERLQECIDNFVNINRNFGT